MDEGAKNGENSSHRENIVEMGYYVVGIMENNV